METKPLAKLVGAWRTKYPDDAPRLLRTLTNSAQVMPKDQDGDERFADSGLAFPTAPAAPPAPTPAPSTEVAPGNSSAEPSTTPATAPAVSPATPAPDLLRAPTLRPALAPNRNRTRHRRLRRWPRRRIRRRRSRRPIRLPPRPTRTLPPVARLPWPRRPISPFPVRPPRNADASAASSASPEIDPNTVPVAQPAPAADLGHVEAPRQAPRAKPVNGHDGHSTTSMRATSNTTSGSTLPFPVATPTATSTRPNFVRGEDKSETFAEVMQQHDDSTSTADTRRRSPRRRTSRAARSPVKGKISATTTTLNDANTDRGPSDSCGRREKSSVTPADTASAASESQFDPRSEVADPTLASEAAVNATRLWFRSRRMADPRGIPRRRPLSARANRTDLPATSDLASMLVQAAALGANLPTFAERHPSDPGPRSPRHRGAPISKRDLRLPTRRPRRNSRGGDGPDVNGCGAANLREGFFRRELCAVLRSRCPQGKKIHEHEHGREFSSGR